MHILQLAFFCCDRGFQEWFDFTLGKSYMDKILKAFERLLQSPFTTVMFNLS